MGDSRVGGQYSGAMWKPFTALTWPSSCEVCNAWPATPVCPACEERHARLRKRCPGCALWLAPGLTRCAACASGQEPDRPDSVHARVDFAHPWTDLVHRFKFDQSPGLARTLAHLMCQDADALATAASCDLVLPIPTATTRLLERGYHPPWELVRHLRRRHTLPPSAADALEHRLDGPALHTLPKSERMAAARHLFKLSSGGRARVRGATVLVVDDVMTTGTTAQAATLALRVAGARAVHVWVFARTPRHEPQAME